MNIVISFRILLAFDFPISVWFLGLYHYDLNAISTVGLMNIAMIVVGGTFVISAFDSLIRLNTDNLPLTAERFDRPLYIAGNIAALCK